MQLWSGLLSPFSAKVRMALAEKGIPVEILEVPWSRQRGWGPKPPEFLAVSPKAQVPVLLDGQTVVYDSTVICEYLEERQSEPPLLPGDPAGRARCRLLEDAADEAVAGPVSTLVHEIFNKPDGQGRDEAALAAARKELEGFYARLDQELAGREFLCGRVSLADLAAYIAVGFASAMGTAPGSGHERLVQWMQRVGARPSVAREFEAMTRAAAAS